jgi:hypothetical protein
MNSAEERNTKLEDGFEIIQWFREQTQTQVTDKV